MVTIKGHFDGKVIVPDEPLDLPVGQRVLVQVEAADGEPSDSQSAVEWMILNAVDDPGQPTDASYQHDHYLYGTPKKP